jgi:hypothetical protein
MAVAGTAMIMPIPPQSQPQAIKDRKATVGERLTLRPKIKGSKKFPNKSMIITKTTSNHNAVMKLNWMAAKRAGPTAAAMAPKVGIKFKKTAKIPQVGAKSRPKSQQARPTKNPNPALNKLLAKM